MPQTTVTDDVLRVEVPGIGVIYIDHVSQSIEYLDTRSTISEKVVHPEKLTVRVHLNGGLIENFSSSPESVTVEIKPKED